MPELPEVQTTATILNSLVVGKKIKDVWTDYNSSHYIGKENIKDPAYFKKFKNRILNKRITRVYRKAKNVLIELDDLSTINIHMKMTGHLLYGEFVFDKKIKSWKASTSGPLQDPFNRFVHLVFTLDNELHIAFSDMRKFATVMFHKDLSELDLKFERTGPEPLDKRFDWKILKEQLLKKPNQKIKTVLMNQELLVGVGNIYSDEILWSSHVHPERVIISLNDLDYKKIVTNMKKILEKGIIFGGDSMSDYRNPYGVPGEFQLHHNAYRRTNKPCNTKECSGIIERKVINGRSAHFCMECQK